MTSVYSTPSSDIFKLDKTGTSCRSVWGSTWTCSTSNTSGSTTTKNTKKETMIPAALDKVKSSMIWRFEKYLPEVLAAKTRRKGKG